MDIKKGVTSILALVIFSAVGVARAQDEPKKTTHMKSRTLTGCLQKGDALWFGDGRRIQDQRVDNRKDRRVGADA